MKYLVLCLLTWSLSTVALEEPKHPMSMERIAGFLEYERMSYFCHLNVVYMAVKMESRDAYFASSIHSASELTLVWDQSRNAPYNCDDFISSRDSVMKAYVEEYEAYQRVKPTPKMRMHYKR